MKTIQFNPSQEDIAAEVANLQEKNITGYSTKHVILYPQIDEEQMIGGVKIKVGRDVVEQQTKDLDVFFPVLLCGPRAAAETSRPPVQPGDFILPTARQNVVKVLHPSILAPITENAVYAFVEDYEVELVKRK